MNYMYQILIRIITFVFFLCCTNVKAFHSIEELGRALFLDPNLSKNRTQSCATCHDPNFAFVDPRVNASGRAVSLGDDGVSLRDRNTPTISYAVFAPNFSRNKEGHFIGGQFLDGRAKDLIDQAKEPILSLTEMNMPSVQSVVERLQENPDYVVAFNEIFGQNIFKNTDRTFHAMAESIAAFERTNFFSPFDSKYDRHLRGEYK